MKNILIISPFLPWPLNSGGNTGVFYMLEYVSKVENVYFLTLYNKQNNNYKNFEQLKKLLPAVHFLMYDYRHTKYRKYEYLRKIFRHIGMRIHFGTSKCNMSQLNYLETITPGLIEYVNTIIQDNKIDVVQIEFLGLHPLVYALPDSVGKVFIHHELGWVRSSQTYSDDMFSAFFKKYTKDCEIAILNDFDVIGTLTSVDQQKLIDAGIQTNVKVSTLAISNKTFPYHKHEFKGRLTFVGGSGHFPNFDGIKWFVSNVLPIVKEHCINVKLEIIGNWPESSRKDVLAIDNSVRFLGFVNDLGEALQDSLMVVPINIGSGMRMKILEAANSSVPFVSTIVGAEGLEFEDGKECYIGKSAEDMADKIIKLIDDKILYENFSKAEHQKFVERYSIESLGEKRLALYEDDEEKTGK